MATRDRVGPSEPPSHRINDQIRVPKVRLIGADGSQVGIVDTVQALAMAVEAELDLVEVAPNADPPVAKILDFGKFRYELAKKEKDSRKRGHQTQIKRMRITPKIDDHDFGVKLKAIRTFLEEGDKVKVTLIFKGRMVTHKELGKVVLDKLIETLADVARTDGPIQMEGARNMVVTLQKK